MINNPKTGMSLIVKTVTRMIVGPVLFFGIYIILHGHLSPGGGFSGGVIVALAFVNMMLSFGQEIWASRLSKTLASNLESFGALMFLIVALMGYAGGAFFMNIMAKGKPFQLFSAGTIPISNISIGIKVGIGVFSIFLALVLLEKSKKE